MQNNEERNILKPKDSPGIEKKGILIPIPKEKIITESQKVVIPIPKDNITTEPQKDVIPKPEKKKNILQIKEKLPTEEDPSDSGSTGSVPEMKEKEIPHLTAGADTSKARIEDLFHEERPAVVTPEESKIKEAVRDFVQPEEAVHPANIKGPDYISNKQVEIMDHEFADRAKEKLGYDTEKSKPAFDIEPPLSQQKLKPAKKKERKPFKLYNSPDEGMLIDELIAEDNVISNQDPAELAKMFSEAEKKFWKNKENM